jgi:hypothetical protein
MSCHLVRSGKGTQCPPTSNFNYILLILRIKLLRNSLRNHPEIPNNTKNQNSEQKEIRIHNERSQQQKSNDNSENLLVNCVFIFDNIFDNNCLYWIENKLFLFYFILLSIILFCSTHTLEYPAYTKTTLLWSITNVLSPG